MQCHDDLILFFIHGRLIPNLKSCCGPSLAKACTYISTTSLLLDHYLNLHELELHDLGRLHLSASASSHDSEPSRRGRAPGPNTPNDKLLIPARYGPLE